MKTPAKVKPRSDQASTGEDVERVTPPKRPRSIRKRPITTMDVDVKALIEAQKHSLEVAFMELCGEAITFGLAPSKAGMAQTLLQNLQTLGFDEARKLLAVHAAVEGVPAPC
eukprot:Skav234465  [mRNA]  locus=scaffold1647:248076:251200:+ [translate_table: standard]